MSDPASRPAFVYVLATGSLRGPKTYVGWTFDLDRRLAEHNGLNAKGAKSTRGAQWQLVYAERHPDKIAAMRREYRLKRERALRKCLGACLP